jgi:endonuclease/exonuclease/phosphatase family metal-dependent hydrolase
MRSLLVSLILLTGFGSALPAEPFSVVVYNAENLFDADGVALFDDYQPASPANPDGYTNEHFLTKLTNTTQLMQLVGGGKGPDIILFQEFEADQTPEKWHGDLVRFLTDTTDYTVAELLTERFTDELAGVPAEVWLYKMMVDAGMREYFIAVSDGGVTSDRPIAHANVTFSRFPILEARTHHSPGARGTLETKVDVGGYPLYLFNSHWKSGASNTALEPTRVGNAQVMRERIDQILRADPQADIIIGGDLNSHYNQSALFPELKATGINTILGSQGNEVALLRSGKPDLYNLWYELPRSERGSDIFRGQWGTLMHLIVSRGLYDFRGVQYIDNSFAVMKKPGMNADAVTGLPVRWNQVGPGGGFSDHFPLLAWFRVVPDNAPNRFLTLRNPSQAPVETTDPRLIDYSGLDLDSAPLALQLAAEAPLQGPEHYSKVLLVESVVSGERPFRVTVGQEEFQIWSFDQELRERIYRDYPVGGAFAFYGELNRFRGNWQFVIQHESWLEVPTVVAEGS